MNETRPGRNGYILAKGRRIFHVYKQRFPMTYWYGLVATANREDSAPNQMIDVRTLPPVYQPEGDERGLGVTALIQRHALTFANALHDGYNLEEHAARETALGEARWAAECLMRANRPDDDDCPF